MQRYFVHEPYEAKAEFTITGENFHHIVHVMRMSPGQQIYLVFDEQVVIRAEILRVSPDEVVVVERKKEQTKTELPIKVTIASGYPKGDKLEWIVQKGTELGAQEFIGFPAKTSVVKWDQKKISKKKQRLEKIAMEAAEQSHRQLAPNVLLLDDKQPLLDFFSSYDYVIVAYEESAKSGERSRFASLLTQMEPEQSVLLIFGPEGGFTKEEVHLFQKHHATLCGLGPRILRAETAPLYALSAISYQFELV